MDKEERLSAGQFAQMLHIDRHVLDNYDKLGLFQPVFRENNGHKWYTLGQMNDWQMMKTSSWLGDNEMPTSFQAGLKQQQAQLEAKMKSLAAAQDRIAESLTRLETASKVVFDKVTEVQRTLAPILETPYDASHSLSETVRTHVTRLVVPDAVTTPIVVGQRLKLATGRVESVYTPLVSGTSHQPDETLAAGRYLLVYHHEPMTEGFQDLMDYATAHQLVLDNSVYRIPIQTTLGESPLRPSIVKLLIKVRS